MGERLGRYEFLERIAVGGMSEVFRARVHGSRGFARPLVVKRMLPHLAATPDAVDMFLHEARIGAALQHPNITAVLDLGEIEGAYFIAMEFVDGPDLQSLLEAGPVPPALAAWIIARAAAGVGYAYAAVDDSGKALKIVHRDISPSNLLISRLGEVKVTDFGVARSAARVDQTATGVVKGKLAYMSPEQLSGEPLDGRSDVYALGIVLWEMITGERLHGGQPEPKVILSIDREVEPPSSVCADLDPGLDKIVSRALSHRREARFDDAGSLSDALDDWLSTKGPVSQRELARWVRSVPTSGGSKKRSPVRGRLSADAPGPADPSSAGMRRLSPARTKAIAPGLRVQQKRSAQPRDLVLYVEDEQDNWEIARLRLKRNYELLHASDDREACAILKARGSELAAVLMDIQLRGSALDGIALTRVLRGTADGPLPDYAEGVPTLKLPVLFVTAYAARYSEAELIEAGGDKLVTKPVNFAELTLSLTSLHLKRIGPA